MNNIETIFNNTCSPAEYTSAYLTHLTQIFSRLDHSAIEKFIELLLDARNERKRIYFIGNGGSAATASHFANDLAVGTRSKNLPFSVMSLTDNTPIITAIGNDYGYDQVFVKQLESYFKTGDILVAISASGNSPNILKAVEYVNYNKGIVVGLTGFDGGKLKNLVDIAIHVPTEKGDYGPVEDVHMILDHLIGTYLMQLCKHVEKSTENILTTN
jgi:D-sedoheptulose 7-phosphate isomerase